MATSRSIASLPERFHGCLIGLAVADALGAPYEGLTSDDIFYRFGAGTHVVTNPDGDTLYYTDDTEMMIGLAETLVSEGHVDGEKLIAAFVANYHPDRGYGRGARQILETAATGGDWREVARTIFPGGSLGNGAAMRVAPVGLLFHDSPEQVWEQAKQSALPTHQHPVGIEGAQLLAHAVSLAVQLSEIQRKHFLTALLDRVETESFQWAIRSALKIKRGDSISGLGSTLHADRSVVTAIVCFVDSPDDYAFAVGRAISLGDDTDTVAAMAGCLVGAFAGIQAIPAKAVEQFERSRKGIAYIRELANRLVIRHTNRVGR
ncbi:ADP-ribosylglycohydrolase family protein [Limnoglobus roseus]|uniref:ADP-ribosylglycohydrolase family protein n=1 Tax=Limnoglobus roseus TaxID=2598579 RepID=A0A5C1AHC3_9BACT|nr:ADP-ribosylglycohydrolase family protein [Limnoglobus roseus]QEL18220.1 ADP-ribosylglycohydrolase family protein [Limnoglobus roseus]